MKTEDCIWKIFLYFNIIGLIDCVLFEQYIEFHIVINISLIFEYLDIEIVIKLLINICSNKYSFHYETYSISYIL